MRGRRARGVGDDRGRWGGEDRVDDPEDVLEARPAWRRRRAVARANSVGSSSGGGRATARATGRVRVRARRWFRRRRQPPAASGAACATARATRSARTWAPPRRRRRRRGSRGADRVAVAPSGLAEEGEHLRGHRRGVRGSSRNPPTAPWRGASSRRAREPPEPRPRAEDRARDDPPRSVEDVVARRWASAATKDAWSGDTSARAAASAARADRGPVMSPERAVPARPPPRGAGGLTTPTRSSVPRRLYRRGRVCSRRCPDRNDSVVSRARAHSATRLERRRRRRDGGRRRASFPDHAPASRSAPTRARPRAWRVTRSSSTRDHPGARSSAARKVSLAASITRRRARRRRRRVAPVPRPASRCSSARASTIPPRPLPPSPSPRPRASPDRCKGGGGPSDGFPRDGLHRARALAPKHTTHPSDGPPPHPETRLRVPRPERRAHHHPGLGRVGRGDGRAVWDSAERLARCVARRSALSALRQHPTAALHVRDVDDARAWWRGKTVVELGAGLGLTSLVAASAGALALCTDGDDRVVRMCAENARA